MQRVSLSRSVHTVGFCDSGCEKLGRQMLRAHYLFVHYHDLYMWVMIVRLGPGIEKVFQFLGQKQALKNFLRESLQESIHF